MINLLEGKTPEDVRAEIATYPVQYQKTWLDWIQLNPFGFHSYPHRSKGKLNAGLVAFKKISHQWKAFRPRKLRYTEDEIEELLRKKADCEFSSITLDFVFGELIPVISDTLSRKFTDYSNLSELWEIVSRFPDERRSRVKGPAGVVSVSKTAMLLTNGMIGPAFDSRVTRKLGIKKIETPLEWQTAMRQIRRDIRGFEAKWCIDFMDCLPEFMAEDLDIVRQVTVISNGYDTPHAFTHLDPMYKMRVFDMLAFVD